MTPRNPRTRRPRNAFTLVEVVVVIAIIVLLSALVLGVGTAVVKSSETRQTTLLLGQLDTAVKEWRAQTDRDVSYGPAVPPYELFQDPVLDSDATAEAVTHGFFAILGRTAAVRDILAKVDSDFAKQISAGDLPVQVLSFVDAWDYAVFVVLPGRAWVQGDPPLDRDLDGTIRTPLEKRLGFARNRQAFLVSAGPDRRLGDVRADADTDEYKQTRDNIYSQVPDLPVPP